MRKWATQKNGNKGNFFPFIKSEISNFEYLMLVNTYANRSYNEYNQYPVFPWIISDYTRTNLNFKDPSMFRDLTKPIGALNPKRLEEYKQRAKNFHLEGTPPFLYGSHYSTSGAVFYWLIRVEPFSSLAAELQNGKFDHPDRLFHSIAQTWESNFSHSSDVKELIPEFFYFPEFLKNRNKIDFGKRQMGETVCDVLLPNWANNPEEFIYLNR